MKKKSLHLISAITVSAIIVAATSYGVWKMNKDIENAIVNIEQKSNNAQGIDISDWQTYRNEEFGFEVKYPKDWTVSVEKNNDIGRKFLIFSNYSNVKNLNKGNAPDDLLLYFFSIYDKNNERAISEYKKIKKSETDFYNEKKEYRDNGIVLYIITTKSKDEDITWDFVLPTAHGFLESNLYTYHFYHGTELLEQKTSMKYLEKSLNTFKFLD